MKNHWVMKSVALLGCIGLACLPLGAQPNGSVPPPGGAVPPVAAPPTGMAVPGTINYIEGQVSVDGQALVQSQRGYTPLAPNQVLSTGVGKAELLLSPGVFLRVGDNSQIRMVSSQITEPQFAIVRGEAMVEVDWMPRDERIGVLENGAQNLIMERGLYQFNSNTNAAAVIDGKMQVTENGKTKDVFKGKEALLNQPKLKTVGFDRKAEDDLYRWSNVRAGYLAEANTLTAQNYNMEGYGPYGPYGAAGWYWDPYYDFWSWMPYDGYFFSPFGYPFFSPGYVGYAPYFGFGYGYGRYGYHGGFAGRGLASRGGVALAPRASGFAGGGFHGGGFGGGGGFHGGGGGGRR